MRTQHGPVDRDPLPLGNKPDPYDELVYILLSNMTRSPPRVHRAYDGLVELAPDGWSELLDADPGELRAVLEPLGFVNRRSAQLLGIAALVDELYGGTLAHLEGLRDVPALAQLTAMPGVGEKTAKCVLMYSLGRSVFPVDIHVLRVVKRLGLVPEDATWNEADRQLEAEVPDELKFDLHVLLVIHGREVCKSRNPDCERCSLQADCPVGLLAPRRRADYVGGRSWE